MELSRRISALKPSPTVALNGKAKELAKSGVKVFNFAVGEPDFTTHARTLLRSQLTHSALRENQVWTGRRKPSAKRSHHRQVEKRQPTFLFSITDCRGCRRKRDFISSVLSFAQRG